MSFSTSQQSTQAVQNFLRPQNSLDRLYIVFLALWFSSAVFIAQTPYIRIFTFSGTIFFLLIQNFSKKFTNGKMTIVGSSIKLFIVYLLISFFNVDRIVMDLQIDTFAFNYYELESIVIIITFLWGIVFSRFYFDLLRYYGIIGYQAFIKSVFRGLWISAVSVYILVSLDVLKPTIVNESVTLPWEEFLLISLIVYLLSSLIPYSYSIISDSLIKKEPFLSLRDSAMGATLSLILLDWWFHQLTFDFWNSLLPLLFVTCLILLALGFSEKNLNESFLSKSIEKIEQMGKNINGLQYQEPEKAYIFNKSTDILKNQHSKVNTKNSVLVPLGFNDNTVIVDVIGNIGIEAKDNLGNLTKDTADKISLTLSKKDYKNLIKSTKKINIKDLNIANYTNNFKSPDEFVDYLKDSLLNYKNKFQFEGIENIQSGLQDLKKNYSMSVSDERSEFNFPGIKVIEEPGSHLFRMGSIEVIEVEKDKDDSKGKARFFDLKMPSIHVTEIEYDGKFFMLEMPFISVLETPKGTMFKMFGFEVVEGNKIAILSDLERLLHTQAKFDNYFQKRMSNVLAYDENPSMILTNKNNSERLLIMGNKDTVSVDSLQESILLEAPKQELIPELTDSEVFEVPVEDVKITIDNPIIINAEISSIDDKLSKLMIRIDQIPKDEFIDYMGFKNNQEFLNWLAKLPESIPLKVKGDTVYFL